MAVPHLQKIWQKQMFSLNLSYKCTKRQALDHWTIGPMAQINTYLASIVYNWIIL